VEESPVYVALVAQYDAPEPGVWQTAALHVEQDLDLPGLEGVPLEVALEQILDQPIEAHGNSVSLEFHSTRLSAERRRV